uniref:Uncharacterized protein n=1 Tax=Davidia involucrata TaxID=16924 RepID=A0A5B7BYG1_DAVIN
MSNNKVHSQGNVPFSWENKPGVSKVTRHDCPTDEGHFKVKLPPPPCPTENVRVSFHDLQIPLPPCAFQPPSRSSSKRGLRKEDDPFLTAYKECTKSTRKGKLSTKKDGVGFGIRKNMSIFSCKQSCSVRDDNMIKVSHHLPNSKSERERERRLHDP